MINLKTPRLSIGDHTPEDLPAMHRLLSDPVTMVYMPDLQTRTLEESRANLEEAIRQAGSPDRTKFFFRILIRETGAYAGDVGYTLTGSVPDGLSAHLGYFLLPEFHGMGIATEAAGAVFDYAFRRGGVALMRTGCDRRNTSSEKIMIKLGMTRESITESRVEYRMTRTDWINRH